MARELRLVADEWSEYMRSEPFAEELAEAWSDDRCPFGEAAEERLYRRLTSELPNSLWIVKVSSIRNVVIQCLSEGDHGLLCLGEIIEEGCWPAHTAKLMIVPTLPPDRSESPEGRQLSNSIPPPGPRVSWTQRPRHREPSQQLVVDVNNLELAVPTSDWKSRWQARWETSGIGPAPDLSESAADHSAMISYVAKLAEHACKALAGAGKQGGSPSDLFGLSIEERHHEIRRNGYPDGVSFSDKKNPTRKDPTKEWKLLKLALKCTRSGERLSTESGATRLGWPTGSYIATKHRVKAKIRQLGLSFDKDGLVLIEHQ